MVFYVSEWGASAVCCVRTRFVRPILEFARVSVMCYMSEWGTCVVCKQISEVARAQVAFKAHTSKKRHLWQGERWRLRRACTCGQV